MKTSMLTKKKKKCHRDLQETNLLNHTWGKRVSVCISVVSAHLSVDLIHEHDILDSVQVWELMS